MPINARIRLAVAMAAVVVLSLPATALAAPAAQDSAGSSNLGWLLAGLAIVWAGFFAYIFYISRKTRDMRRELDELRDRVGRRD